MLHFLNDISQLLLAGGLWLLFLLLFLFLVLALFLVRHRCLLSNSHAKKISLADLYYTSHLISNVLFYASYEPRRLS